MTLLVLGLGIGWAAETLSVDIGEDAWIVVLPPAQTGILEVLVHDTDQDLSQTPLVGPLVEQASVLPSDGDSYLIRLDARGTQNLVAGHEGRFLTLVVKDTPVPAQMSGNPIDIAALLVPPEQEPLPIVEAPLSVFTGQDLARGLTPARALAALMPPPVAPDWEQIDTLRNEMLAQTEDQRGPLILDLATALHAIGNHREASYYYGLHRPTGSEELLAYARSALAAGRIEHVPGMLLEADAKGAFRADVLEAVAVLALWDPSLSKQNIAYALATTSARPESLLVAADLLQKEGRFTESLAPLQLAAENGLGPLEETLHLRLGDAFLHTQAFEAARRHYAQSNVTVRDHRMLMASLLASPPRAWPRSLPDLTRLARQPKQREALYTLAQVQAALGDSNDSIESLAFGMRVRRLRNPAVTRLLWEQMVARVHVLRSAGRPYDIALLYEHAWHPALREVVTSTAALEIIASAFEELALPLQATEVLKQAFAVQNVHDRKDPWLMIRLAILYGQTHRPEEGLRTLDYDGPPADPEAAAAWNLAKGELLLDLNQPDASRGALLRAAKVPATASAANLALARLDLSLGDCRAAEPRLATVQEPLAPQLDLAWSRCLAAMGRTTESQALAAEASARLTEDPLQSYARYLAGTASPSGDTWSALSTEREAHDDLRALISQRKRQ